MGAKAGDKPGGGRRRNLLPIEEGCGDKPGDAATGKIATSQRSANGPNCSWSLLARLALQDRRWLIGQNCPLDLRRPLRYGTCTDSTLGLDGEETIGYRIKQRKLSWADHAKRHAGEFNTRTGPRPLLR